MSSLFATEVYQISNTGYTVRTKKLYTGYIILFNKIWP